MQHERNEGKPSKVACKCLMSLPEFILSLVEIKIPFRFLEIWTTKISIKFIILFSLQLDSMKHNSSAEPHANTHEELSKIPQEMVKAFLKQELFLFPHFPTTYIHFLFTTFFSLAFIRQPYLFFFSSTRRNNSIFFLSEEKLFFYEKSSRNFSMRLHSVCKLIYYLVNVALRRKNRTFFANRAAPIQQTKVEWKIAVIPSLNESFPPLDLRLNYPSFRVIILENNPNFCH